MFSHHAHMGSIQRGALKLRSHVDWPRSKLRFRTDCSGSLHSLIQLNCDLKDTLSNLPKNNYVIQHNEQEKVILAIVLHFPSNSLSARRINVQSA